MKQKKKIYYYYELKPNALHQIDAIFSDFYSKIYILLLSLAVLSYSP